MRERIKGRTVVAGDEGDDANGVLIKLYGEETNGTISIIELNRLGEPHGIRFFDDWIPDLKAAYDLRVVGGVGDVAGTGFEPV